MVSIDEIRIDTCVDTGYFSMPPDDGDDPPTDTEFVPEDSFAVLGNELRIEILWLLYDAFEEGPPYARSFSELRSRITADIAPSQLNYHLQQLVGDFVEKRDEGYRLRPAGRQLCRALRAGILPRSQSRERTSVDAEFACHYCQASVEAVFDEEVVYVKCPKCEYVYTASILEIPRDAFVDESELFRQFSKYIHCKTIWRACGICTVCGNPLEAEFHTSDEVPLMISQRRNKVEIDRSCTYCSTPAYHTLGTELLIDPGLISFCHDHGVNLLSPPVWDLDFIWTDKHVTVRSTDPWEVTLQATFGDDRLELVIDGDVNVVERNRLDATDSGPRSLLRDVHRSGHSLGSKESGEKVVLPDNTDCLQALRRHRWPDGVTCPHCDSADTIKKGMTSKDAQRYRCHDCGSIFNDLTGTIFAEHRFSLPEMFYITWEMEEKDTTQIARELDRPYNSVLDFVHKVRDTLGEDIQ